MDAAVRETAALVVARGATLVTIEEVSHYSLESHTFHFELMKRLHAVGGFTCFSSERLGRLDAFLMNLWLDGQIDCTLAALYDALPFGGLGTFRWMEYFRATRRPFVLAGLEIDDFSYVKLQTLRLVKSLCSPAFARAMAASKLRAPVAVTAVAVTANDRAIRDIVNATHATPFDTHRQRVWFERIRACLAEHGNLFINGFHMSRGSIAGEGKDLLMRHALPHALSIGMRSFHAQRRMFLLTDDVLKTHGWTRATAVRAFERALSADDFAHYRDFYAQSVVDDVSKHTDTDAEAERLYGNGVRVVDAKSIPDVFGASLFPAPGKPASKPARRVKKRHDYLVFLPKSTLHTKGWMRM